MKPSTAASSSPSVSSHMSATPCPFPCLLFYILKTAIFLLSKNVLPLIRRVVSSVVLPFVPSILPLVVRSPSPLPYLFTYVCSGTFLSFVLKMP